ncbi:SDR family NAD(P)-dependent oxidoreductase [Rhizorhabdus wittichii]|uniref:SDR family NAD(P)-dependent oxidoreductase n=1 Tax=Rhizorhabdus wittichii TaxID=160791 RepID=UPI00030D2C04|nr:SDR family oxidoreductase [Rhizorhabdus wittichii]
MSGCSVEGRTAFVTGGASGIGLGIARALIGRGARVAIADVDGAAIERAVEALSAAGRVEGVVLDVRDRDGWQAARVAVEAALGPVGLLVNNAGVTGYDPVVDTPPAHFDWIVGVNLTGAFNGVHCFGRAMIDRGEGGHILNTASIAGLYGSNALTVGAYAASKFGLVGLSERLRVELAPHGIGVSLLCPGLVSTAIGANAAKLRPGPAGMTLADNPAFAGLRQRAPTAGLDPDRLGPFVVRAIEENRAYIIPHPHFAEQVEARHAALMADFGEPADPDLPLAPDWRDLA